MKGHPPWPAQVDKVISDGRACSVTFFGTGECSPKVYLNNIWLFCQTSKVRIDFLSLILHRYPLQQPLKHSNSLLILL